MLWAVIYILYKKIKIFAKKINQNKIDLYIKILPRVLQFLIVPPHFHYYFVSRLVLGKNKNKCLLWQHILILRVKYRRVLSVLRGTAFSRAKRGQLFWVLRITPILQGRISLVKIFLPPLSKIMLGSISLLCFLQIWNIKHLICD